MPRIFFTGCHGTGKSQTAIKVAEALGYEYIPSFAGPIAKDMGFDLNQPHTPRQLILYQERVLEAFCDSFIDKRGENVIYDRSPNDIAAYAYFGIKGYEEYEVQMRRFIRDCLDITEQYCDLLIYPRAELITEMEDKFNRPTAYNRSQFDETIRFYFNYSRVNKLEVPVEYQYEKRVQYILDNM